MVRCICYVLTWKLIICHLASLAMNSFFNYSLAEINMGIVLSCSLDEIHICEIYMERNICNCFDMEPYIMPSSFGKKYMAV